MTTEQQDKQELDEAAALDQYQWLVNQSGSQLQDYAGGTIHAPVANKALVEHLDLVAERAAALADYYRGEGAEDVDDPSLTRIDDLPEETQKRIREDEEAKGGVDRDLYEAQGLDPDQPVADPQPPESKAAKVTDPYTRASEGLTPAQAAAQQKKAGKDKGESSNS